MPYPLPLTRTEAYLAYKAGVIQQSDLKPSLAVPRNGIDAWLAYWTGLAADYPKREDGTPHILQEEEAYIAYLCGVINEYPEKCLRRVGAYLRYLISARWGKPDHPLNREELYLSLIKTQFIPSGDPSSDIVIDGTTKAPFVDVKMYGDTFQQSYTGKNLLQLIESSRTISGVTLTLNSDGTFGLAGTATADIEFSRIVSLADSGIVGGQSYTISSDAPIETLGITYYVHSVNSVGQWNKTLLGFRSAGTQTAATPSTDYIKFVVRVGNGATVNYSSIKTMIEAGSTATAYEPYVGGAPSPNPDYPQPIQTVTGEQTVTITGKNLWGGFANDFSKTSQGVSYTNKADGAIFANGTSSGNSLSFLSSEAISNGRIITLQAGDYVLSGGTSIVLLQVVSSSGKEIAETASDGVKAFNLSEATDIFVRARMARDTVADNVTIKPMLEKGSTATAYEPYSSNDYEINLGNIELCKLGTYQDYIWKDGDSWKVHKATAKTILDSSSFGGWTSTTAAEGYFRGSSARIGFPSAVCFCNCLTYRTGAHGSYEYIWTQPTDIGAVYIQILATRLEPADITGFNNWINSVKPILFYTLTTATDTVITDTDLIAQLEALVAGGAENGTTYIKVNATDPNLPAKLYVEAPKYD